jgi:hypothetical protein
LHKEDKNYIEIWGDNVKLRDLLLSMVLCIVFALGGYILALGDAPQPLILGLIGGVIGFIISSILIKPKRRITVLGEEDK